MKPLMRGMHMQAQTNTHYQYKIALTSTGWDYTPSQGKTIVNQQWDTASHIRQAEEGFEGSTNSLKRNILVEWKHM